MHQYNTDAMPNNSVVDATVVVIVNDTLSCVHRSLNDSSLLPSRASEQGNVIGLVSVYIYIYIYIYICVCVQNKIVISELGI